MVGLSTCGGFQEHLPDEVRADFEQLMLSGSRALEFLASQGCTARGNLVLSRRDALLAGVRYTVPAEEVARLRYSPLPETVALFPPALLDSALSKMRASGERHSCSTDAPSSQDSSEACGGWSVNWIVDVGFGMGELFWSSTCSEADGVFFPIRPGWQKEEELQG